MKTPLLLFLLPALSAVVLLLGGWFVYRRLILIRAILGALLVLAGCGVLLAFQDYRWAPQIRQALPAHSLIVQQHQQAITGHPWTRWHPPVTAIEVITQIETGPEQGDGAWLEFDQLQFALEQGQQPLAQRFMLNCATGDRVSTTANGLLIESLPASDPYLRLLCQPQ